MSAVSWKRIRRIVGEALELEGDARRAYLDAACAGDAALRADVERILAGQATGAPGFLDPPAAPKPPAEPHRVLGEFELLRELGRGGMGVVYLARQARLSREVAVKVLSKNPATAERDVERFHREARAVAGLRHPGIVQVFADGQDGDTHWFAMEFVRGHDLHRELKLQQGGEVLESDRPFLPRLGEPAHAAWIARLCADVADALEHAHAQGLVHRDVKPQNILLQPDGRVQIVDFGLVRDESLGTITQTGEVAGTPHYMSPEQARVRQERVDHRTDVYSLGVVLYELATHHRPFEGETSADVIAKIRDTDPRTPRAWNPTIPRDLQTICLKAMAKEPRARYATAGELRDDLRRFVDHQAILAKPPGPLDRSRRWLRRNRQMLGTLALVAVALWVGALVASRVAKARTLGRVSVAAQRPGGPPVSGTVALQRLDPITGLPGEPRTLGALPLQGRRVEPGYYRVVVDLEGEGRRVFAREIDAQEEVAITAEVRPEQRERDGMVRIEGGILALRDEDAPLVAINGLDVEIPSFWIDATEVSNAQYRGFLAATGHEPPGHWDRIGAQHDDYPVCNVSWTDARAYAEWAGKHLPSYTEWTWAARGSEGRIYPWEGAVRGEYRGNVHHERIIKDRAVHEELYFQRAAAVRSSPEARTPEGLYHMLGNVWELTETPPADLREGTPIPMPMLRIVAGHTWDAAEVGQTLESFGFVGVERTSALYRTGFRCIVSDASP